jgi:hypothetical protein
MNSREPMVMSEEIVIRVTIIVVISELVIVIESLDREPSAPLGAPERIRLHARPTGAHGKGVAFCSTRLIPPVGPGEAQWASFLSRGIRYSRALEGAS